MQGECRSSPDPMACSFNGVASTSNTFKNVDNRSFTNVKINGKTVN